MALALIPVNARPPKELYEDAAQRSLLVYRVCEYLRLRNPNVEGGCQQCPRTIRWRDQTCYRGCYMLAEELIAVVNHGLSLPTDFCEQDNEPRKGS
jgi:hypothetical protein